MISSAPMAWCLSCPSHVCCGVRSGPSVPMTSLYCSGPFKVSTCPTLVKPSWTELCRLTKVALSGPSGVQLKGQSRHSSLGKEEMVTWYRNPRCLKKNSPVGFQRKRLPLVSHFLQLPWNFHVYVLPWFASWCHDKTLSSDNLDGRGFIWLLLHLSVLECSWGGVQAETLEDTVGGACSPTWVSSDCFVLHPRTVCPGWHYPMWTGS